MSLLFTLAAVLAARDRRPRAGRDLLADLDRAMAADRDYVRRFRLLSPYTAGYWGSAPYAGYWRRPYGYPGYYGWY